MAKGISCVMAHDGDWLVGFATWTLTVPAGAGLALYMKEIFVDETARGQGVGRSLLAGILARAAVEGCVRMDWQTERRNATSRAFYANIAAPEHEKKTCRIMAEDFCAFPRRPWVEDLKRRGSDSTLANERALL